MPAVHRHDGPPVATRRLRVVEATASPCVSAFDVAAHAPRPPSAAVVPSDVLRLTASPRTRHVPIEAGPRAVSVRVEVPAARRRDIGTALRAHRVRHRPSLPAPRTTALCETRAAGPPRLLPARPADRAVRPLPPIAVAPVRPRPDGSIHTLTLRRRSWEDLDRRRLATAWHRIVTEHGLPGGELGLVGVFGPLPLEAVTAVSLRRDGGLSVRVERPHWRGRIGDLVLARHEPTGRLIRSDVPWPG